MSRTPLFWLLSTLLALGACDDEPEKTNNTLPDCGNGVAEPTLDEQCDGADLGGLTCRSLNEGFDGGLLACDAQCRLDSSGCLGCDDLCASEGQTRCHADGAGIETCAGTEAGCLAWTHTPCEDPTPSCEVIEEVPTCVR